jgi:hypothetical protein
MARPNRYEVTRYFFQHTTGIKIAIPDISVGRSGKLLLALASTIILDSEFLETHGHILLTHDSVSRATPP